MNKVLLSLMGQGARGMHDGLKWKDDPSDSICHLVLQYFGVNDQHDPIYANLLHWQLVRETPTGEFNRYGEDRWNRLN